MTYNTISTFFPVRMGNIFINIVADVSPSYLEARRAGKKSAGGVSHRFRPQDQPPRTGRRMIFPLENSTAPPGRVLLLRHTGGYRHRLISVGLPGQRQKDGYRMNENAPAISHYSIRLIRLIRLLRLLRLTRLIRLFFFSPETRNGSPLGPRRLPWRRLPVRVRTEFVPLE